MQRGYGFGRYSMRNYRRHVRYDAPEMSVVRLLFSLKNIKEADLLNAIIPH
jgi:hypothetical protein